jgi:hypothetical protein
LIVQEQSSCTIKRSNLLFGIARRDFGQVDVVRPDGTPFAGPLCVAGAGVILGSEDPGRNHVHVLVVISERGGHIGGQDVFCLTIERQSRVQVKRLIGFSGQGIKRLAAIAVALGKAVACPVDAQPVLGMRIVFDPTLTRDLGVGLDFFRERREDGRVYGIKRDGQPNTAA